MSGHCLGQSMSTNRVPSVVTGQGEHFVILLLFGLFSFALLYIQEQRLHLFKGIFIHFFTDGKFEKKWS